MNKLPIGISIPIQHGKNGFFDQTLDTNQNAMVNLKIFFSTRKGERRFNVDFGTKLWNMLFENSDTEIGFDILKDIVKKEIEYWFPQIVLNSIQVEKDENSNIYGFRIIVKFYSTKYSSEPQTLTIEP